MAFIDRFARACGGSRSLAWLLTVNVAAGIAIWIAALVLRKIGIGDSVLYTLLALPSDAWSFATHPWTLITYMFTHMSVLHLLFNMLWLFWFGGMLSDIERPDTVAKIFISGGIAGGILYVASSWLAAYPPGSYLTGSSASVLAVMCVAGLRLPYRSINLFLLGEVKLKWIALACVVLTLAGNWGAGIPPQAAHSGGILFGCLWFLLRRKMRLRRPTTKRQTVHINSRTAVKAMRMSAGDHDRLDELLDKVRISGYDSLTAREKNELNYISSRIKEQ